MIVVSLLTLGSLGVLVLSLIIYVLHKQLLKSEGLTEQLIEEYKSINKYKESLELLEENKSHLVTNYNLKDDNFSKESLFLINLFLLKRKLMIFPSSNKIKKIVDNYLNQTDFLNNKDNHALFLSVLDKELPTKYNIKKWKKVFVILEVSRYIIGILLFLFLIASPFVLPILLKHIPTLNVIDYIIIVFNVIVIYALLRKVAFNLYDVQDYIINKIIKKDDILTHVNDLKKLIVLTSSYYGITFSNESISVLAKINGKDYPENSHEFIKEQILNIINTIYYFVVSSESDVSVLEKTLNKKLYLLSEQIKPHKDVEKDLSEEKILYDLKKDEYKEKLNEYVHAN